MSLLQFRPVRAELHVADGLPQPQRSLAFVAVALVMLIAVLDTTIVNIALPTITRQLRIDPVDAVWVVSVYQLVLTMALLPMAALGDVLSHRRLYLIGVILFTAASLTCALASSLSLLIVARGLQGLAAAMVMGLNAAIVRFIYPNRMLGRAVGNMALIVAVASATGPTIAGLILTVGPWQTLFLVNVPIGVAAASIGYFTLPFTAPSGGRLKFGSVILSAATFGLLISGLNLLGYPDRSALAWAEIILGAGVAMLFVRHERRLAKPMLPIDLLVRPIFALSAATSVCSFSAQGLAFICLPFLLHDALHRTISETGLLITPWPIATAVSGFFSGRLADRLAPGKLSAAGLAVFAAGLLLLANLPPVPSDPDLIWRLAIAGLGFGLFQAPNNKILLSSAPRARSGGANGIQATGRLLGQSLGVAFFAIIIGVIHANPMRVALDFAALLAAAGIVPSALRRFEPTPSRSGQLEHKINGV